MHASAFHWHPFWLGAAFSRYGFPWPAVVALLGILLELEHPGLDCHHQTWPPLAKRRKSANRVPNGWYVEVPQEWS